MNERVVVIKSHTDSKGRLFVEGSYYLLEEDEVHEMVDAKLAVLESEYSAYLAEKGGKA